MSDDASAYWYAFFSQDEGREYYYSPNTNQTTWTLPDSVQCSDTIIGAENLSSVRTCDDDDDSESDPTARSDDASHTSSSARKPQKRLWWIPVLIVPIFGSLGLYALSPDTILLDRSWSFPLAQFLDRCESPDYGGQHAETSEQVVFTVHKATATIHEMLERVQKDMENMGVTVSDIGTSGFESESHQRLLNPQKASSRETPQTCRNILAFLWNANCRSVYQDV